MTAAQDSKIVATNIIVEALWDSASEPGTGDTREERRVSVRQKGRTCVGSFTRAYVQYPHSEEAER